MRIPEGVSFISAAGVVGDGVRAYMALHYQARLCAGDSVLVVDAASSFGTLCIQLAQLWGAKVRKQGFPIIVSDFSLQSARENRNP